MVWAIIRRVETLIKIVAVRSDVDSSGGPAVSDSLERWPVGAATCDRLVPTSRVRR
jgi:hypothetical protein